MSFTYAEIDVADTPEGADLIHEYAKLHQQFMEKGDNHGYSIVCQIFAHKDNPRKFFLSGGMLPPEKTTAIAEILGVKKSA